MPKRSLNREQKIEQLNRAVEAMLAKPAAKLPAVDPSLDPLLRVGRELRALPRESFKVGLKNELQRSTSMATTTEPVAAARTVASPRLSFKNAAKAIEFYKKAFGAKETFRFENESGIGHAEIMIGDSVIMLAEEWPEGGRFSAETLGKSPISMVLNVPQVDVFVEHAVSAGAKLISAPADQFYGHRDATVLDPFGYSWNVFTRKEEMSVEEMHRRFRAEQKPQPAETPIPAGFRTVTPYLVAQDGVALIDFVKETFGAAELHRSIGSAGGIHAEVRIGDSVLMIGGGGPGLAWRGDALPAALHVYVPDTDAVYRRALEAGATSIQAPADQNYGERSASVKDAASNHWYIATSRSGSYIPEGLNNVNVYLHPLRAEPMIRFLQRAFGARELARYATPDGVVRHAQIRIGDSVVEMGEAHGPYQPMSSMFYLYVPNCDLVYRNALASGATSASEPQDQPYGDRNAGVNDPFGNQWYIATPLKK
jgi:PhnB protein